MRVLIVEDDASIAANLYDFLEAHGHVVDAAGDGVTGLHLATANDFDAILLDVSLPRRHTGTPACAGSVRDLSRWPRVSRARAR